ncbi:unnamed protein product [Heligmosomoides polygyrus]|uniref:Uncharacterized protein n=1 Tax=Heligmosomoides polygyrus TaxID=6339 RepID=A0A3P7ULD7_HELPZ|nr:unnamed protein product [Heligmosomoides polygyrus]
MQAYNEEADSLPADTSQLSDILEKVKTDSVNAENVLERAMFSRTVIEEQLEELAITTVTNTPPCQGIPRIKLVPIPIPKFSGQIWECEAFWSAFEYSVHTRNDMDDIYKMN